VAVVIPAAPAARAARAAPRTPARGGGGSPSSSDSAPAETPSKARTPRLAKGPQRDVPCLSCGMLENDLDASLANLGTSQLCAVWTE